MRSQLHDTNEPANMVLASNVPWRSQLHEPSEYGAGLMAMPATAVGHHTPRQIRNTHAQLQHRTPASIEQSHDVPPQGIVGKATVLHNGQPTARLAPRLSYSGAPFTPRRSNKPSASQCHHLAPSFGSAACKCPAPHSMMPDAQSEAVHTAHATTAAHRAAVRHRADSRLAWGESKSPRNSQDEAETARLAAARRVSEHRLKEVCFPPPL